MMRFSLALFGYDFTPSLWSTALVLLFLPFLLSLGCWQLRRAEFKQQLLHEYATRASAQPISLGQLSQRTEETWAFTHVKAQGRFIKKPLLLDHQFNKHHRYGYQLLLPLQTAEGVVLVNRGWISPGASRQQLPAVEVPAGRQTVTGMVRLYNKPAFRLSKALDARPGWPKIIQTFDSQVLKRLLERRVWPKAYSGVLVIAPLSQPIVNMPPAKHTAYAVQWFCLAIALFLLYLIVNMRKTP